MAHAIEHLVVLMLENRSFDNMLGWLYPGRADFDGLSGEEFNLWRRPDGARRIAVWNDPSATAADAHGPAPDPGELFSDMQAQFFGADSGGAVPDMGGFVDNYMSQPRAPDGSVPDPRAVMHAFSPAQAPVLSLLARSFGVSDRWFASAPCQTWPNRFFAHTGTAGGWVNNEPQHWPYRMPSIFRRLSDHGRSWAIYFHDLPNTANVADIWSDLPTPHFRLFHKEFEEDAARGALPGYCFIEPRYFVGLVRHKTPNDQHPPTYLAAAEALVARAYNALRSGPGWAKTLFVIVYDEHGGLYDHVPPPAATPPGGPYPDGFAFDRFGARVPAVLVSPHIRAGRVLRPAGETPFDHCSIIKTVQELFDLGEPLTARVAAAPSLLPLLGADGPVNPGPARLDYRAPPVTREEIRRLRRVDNRSGMRFSMLKSVALALGMVARVSAHFRHVANKAVRGLRRR